MGRPLKPRSLSPTPKTTRTRRWLPQWLLRGRPLEPRALSPKPKTTRTTSAYESIDNAAEIAGALAQAGEEHYVGMAHLLSAHVLSGLAHGADGTDE